MKSLVAVLTYRRLHALKSMLAGLEEHCPLYHTVVFEDCGQLDATSHYMKQGRLLVRNEQLMSSECVVDQTAPLSANSPNTRFFLGDRNLGVTGNSNRAIKYFLDGDWDHLCLCNDDLFVTGDFVNYYAKAHQDLDVGMFCFCVAGDTPLITKNGVVSIQSAVGKSIEIWNGEKWSKVVPKKTGTSQRLYRVTLSDGSYLDCTAYHRFSVKKRGAKDFRVVQTKDLTRGLQCEPFKIDKQGGNRVANAYTIGFAVGDGHKATVTNKSGTSYAYTHIYLYANKQKCPVSGKRYDEPNQNRIRVVADIDPALVQALKDDAQAINALFLWDKDSIVQFFAGLADADGTVTGCGSLRITVAQKERAKKLQLLLRSVGIRASVGLDRRAGVRTNKGPLTRDLYYLQIAECASIKCYRLVPIPHISRTAQTIKDVKELPGSYDVFCFSEPETHKGVFGNVLTYQCDFDKASPAISGHPDTYKWATHRWRGYTLKLLPRFTGIMISVTRKLVDKIGYFDAEFGKFGEEHCTTGDTPIWMGDFTFKPIADVNIGDFVIGWERRKDQVDRPDAKNVADWRTRTLCRTRVIEKGVHIEQAVVRVTFASGRKVTCTPDHLWALFYDNKSYKGHRYEFAEPSVGSVLTHVVTPVVWPITEGYKKGYIKGALDGDGSYRTNEVVLRVQNFHFTSRFRDYAKGFAELSESGPDPETGLYTTRLLGNPATSDFWSKWEPETEDEWRGWLGGIYDAEGHGRTIGQSQKVNPDVCAKIYKALDLFGFDHYTQDHQICIKGGRQELLRFWLMASPACVYKIEEKILAGRFKTADRVVSIEPAGSATVYGLKTETGNYVAGGYASKNCDYTIRARFAGGIKCEGQDVNCLDVEHSFLRHQDVQTSMTGAARVNADREAGVVMQRAAFEYRFRHYHRPFRLVYPTMANGYYGGGIPCRQLEQIGYKLVSALSS